MITTSSGEGFTSVSVEADDWEEKEKRVYPVIPLWRRVVGLVVFVLCICLILPFAVLTFVGDFLGTPIMKFGDAVKEWGGVGHPWKSR